MTPKSIGLVGGSWKFVLTLGAVGEPDRGLKGVLVVVVQLDALGIGVAAEQERVDQRDVDRELRRELTADSWFNQFLVRADLDGEVVGELYRPYASSSTRLPVLRSVAQTKL